MAGRGDSRRLDQLIRSLDELAGGRPVQDVVEQLGDTALELVDQGFLRGAAPTGRRWPQPQGRSGPPMIRTGRLRRSYVLRVGTRRFEISTSQPYAFMLQTGRPNLAPRKTLPERDLPARWDRVFRERAAQWMRSVMR